MIVQISLLEIHEIQRVNRYLICSSNHTDRTLITYNISVPTYIYVSSSVFISEFRSLFECPPYMLDYQLVFRILCAHKYVIVISTESIVQMGSSKARTSALPVVVDLELLYLGCFIFVLLWVPLRPANYIDVFRCADTEASLLHPRMIFAIANISSMPPLKSYLRPVIM